MKAEILTPWIGDGLTMETAFRPAVIDDYPSKFTDKSAQPADNLTPEPNLLVVEVDADENTIDNIGADSSYSVMWKDTGKDSMPDAAEFGLLRAQLAQAGVKQSEIKSVIGINVSGRTRAEIATTLKEWLKTRPKGI